MGWQNQPASKVSHREQSYSRRIRTASGKAKKNHEKWEKLKAEGNGDTLVSLFQVR